MARYFKNTSDPSRPMYGVLGDKEHSLPVNTYADVNPTDPPSPALHAYGYAHLKHSPQKESPNFGEGGSIWGDNPEPTELFTHKPETLEVDRLYSHPEVRPHMMTIMALATRDHPTAQITSSDSLTGFSSTLARNASKRGLVKAHRANKDMNVTNRSEIDDFTNDQLGTEDTMKGHTLSWSQPEKVTEFSRSEVMAGKQFLRQMLRPGATNQKIEESSKPQSEQLKLPGI